MLATVTSYNLFHAANSSAKIGKKCLARAAATPSRSVTSQELPIRLLNRRSAPESESHACRSLGCAEESYLDRQRHVAYRRIRPTHRNVRGHTHRTPPAQ